ncbi:MAG: secretion system protein [Chloroflexota bacterium]|nr:MAG: secretion system protein [Chloroflexota bacterium]
MDAVLIVGATFMTVFLLVMALGGALSQERRLIPRRMAAYGVHDTTEAVQLDSGGGSVLRQKKLSSIDVLDRLLARRDFAEELAAELARANLPLRVGEYLLIRWLSALLLLAAGTLVTGNILIGLAAAVVGYLVPKLYVNRAEQKRLREFNDQLVDGITLVSNSLKSGYSFLQGMEAVTKDMTPPIAQEFGIALQEMYVGARAEEALTNLTKRVRSDDLDLLATSMIIQRTVGGNLSEILDNIAYTIRERLRIQRDLRTLTAQERMSGWVIGAMPVVLIGLISVLNRQYVGMLFSTTAGNIMLGAAVVLELIGFWMIKRIVAIEV